MQLSHLEEVLDGFYDLCYAGSKVDIVVYTTVLVSMYVLSYIGGKFCAHLVSLLVSLL